MAKKEKSQTVVLEDVELKPQVIGMTYQKKSNLPRILFIFAVLILVVYFIDDISVFVNNLLGRKTAESIQIRADENNNENAVNNENKIMVCQNDNEVITYKFTNNELIEIKYAKEDNNVTDENYDSRYMILQNKKKDYDKIDGIITNLNKNDNGYSVVITMDLTKINESIMEKYYFNHKESSENVLEKMNSNGYNCK